MAGGDSHPRFRTGSRAAGSPCSGLRAGDERRRPRRGPPSLFFPRTLPRAPVTTDVAHELSAPRAVLGRRALLRAVPSRVSVRFRGGKQPPRTCVEGPGRGRRVRWLRGRGVPRCLLQQVMCAAWHLNLDDSVRDSRRTLRCSGNLVCEKLSCGSSPAALAAALVAGRLGDVTSKREADGKSEIRVRRYQ